MRETSLFYVVLVVVFSFPFRALRGTMLLFSVVPVVVFLFSFRASEEPSWSLRQEIADMNPADVAAVMDEMEDDESLRIFRILEQ